MDSLPWFGWLIPWMKGCHRRGITVKATGDEN